MPAPVGSQNPSEGSTRDNEPDEWNLGRFPLDVAAMKLADPKEPDHFRPGGGPGLGPPAIWGGKLSSLQRLRRFLEPGVGVRIPPRTAICSVCPGTKIDCSSPRWVKTARDAVWFARCASGLSDWLVLVL